MFDAHEAFYVTNDIPQTENENSAWPANEGVYESEVNLSSTWRSDYVERPKKRARSTEGGADEGHDSF